MERLIQKGAELVDMELLSEAENTEFTMLSEALDEYGRAYHLLPGQMSTLLADAILFRHHLQRLAPRSPLTEFRHSPQYSQGPWCASRRGAGVIHCLQQTPLDTRTACLPRGLFIH